jgi:cytochrome c oxidase subunit 2
MNRRLAAAVLTVAALTACNGTGNSSKADAKAGRGRELAQEKLCVSCHSADGTRKAGPTWKGLYAATVTLDDGTTVTADEDYLRESMLHPSAKTVKGFDNGVMETVIKPNSLTPDEVDALIAYIRTL